MVTLLDLRICAPGVKGDGKPQKDANSFDFFIERYKPMSYNLLEKSGFREMNGEKVFVSNHYVGIF